MQQFAQRFHVLGTVREYLLALLGGKRPATDDAIAHRVFALGGNAAQAEICKAPIKPGSFWTFTVYLAFEFGLSLEMF